MSALNVSNALEEENDGRRNHVGVVVLEDAIEAAPFSEAFCEIAYFRKFDSDFKTTSLD